MSSVITTTPHSETVEMRPGWWTVTDQVAPSDTDGGGLPHFRPLPPALRSATMNMWSRSTSFAMPPTFTRKPQPRALVLVKE